MSSLHKLLILLAVALTSCAPAKILTESQRDSVIVHVRDSVFVRDTVVMAAVPAESGANILPDTDTSFLSTSLAESRAFIENGQLRHTLRNRSEKLLPVKVQYIDHVRSEKTDALSWRQIVQTVEVEKELSKWQQFVMNLGYGFIIIVAAWVIMKIVARFLPLPL